MKIRNRNVNQVSNRYKTLMRSYKQVVDNNKKTGSAEKTHAYKNELGEVLKDYPKIRPVHTLSSSALVESSSEGTSSFTPSPPPLNLPQGLHPQ